MPAQMPDPRPQIVSPSEAEPTRWSVDERELIAAIEAGVELLGDPWAARGAAKLIAERLMINVSALAWRLRDDGSPHGR